MGITETQRERRILGIGSSDLAALIGLDKRKNAYDLWLEKTGKVVPPQPSGAAIDTGNLMNDPLCKYSERILGPVRLNQLRVYEPAYIRCHIDAIVVETGAPVEAKSAGWFYTDVSEWGEEGTDQIPANVTVQCHGHLISVNKGPKPDVTDVCHAPAFLSGRGFQMFQSPMDEDLSVELIDISRHFMEEHVQKDVPPDDSIPHLEVVKYLKGDPAVTVQIDPSLVRECREARRAASEAERAKRVADAALIAALGRDGVGDAGSEGIVQYKRFEKKAEKEPRAGYEYWQLSGKRIRVSTDEKAFPCQWDLVEDLLIRGEELE